MVAAARKRDQFFDPDGIRALLDQDEPAPVDLAAYMKRSGDIIADAMDYRKRGPDRGRRHNPPAFGPAHKRR
jgi:hypothetical protein